MAPPNPTNPVELQKPAGSPQAEEVVIHVIPEKFYGAALRKKVVPEKPPAVPPPAPAVPPPGGPPVPPAKKRSKAPLVIVLVLILLLGGGGAAAFFLLRKPAPKGNQNRNANAAVNAAKAVCGDAKCDKASETAQNCPADCGQPAPVCGDSKCESSSETAQNCPADCGPAPAACGNKQCETGEDVESCPSDCTPPEPEPGPDSDSDGLSDKEEGLYGTNPLEANTDHDSFVDLNEVVNLFDPALPAPAMLRDNPGIATYSNADYGYSILRPSAWTVEEKDGTREVFFRAPSGEFIEVIAEQKPESQGLMDWYLAQAPNVRSSDVEIFKTRQGLDEVVSPDKMTAFVSGGDRVLVITYALGIQTKINFKITHLMMVNSLAITGPATFPPPAETPSVPEPALAPVGEPAPSGQPAAETPSASTGGAPAPTPETPSEAPAP